MRPGSSVAQTAHPQSVAVQNVLIGAGARLVRVQRRSLQSQPPATFTYDTVEVMAQCMNALRPPDSAPHAISPTLFKTGKRALARCLVLSSPAERVALLEPVVQSLASRERERHEKRRGGGEPQDAALAVNTAEQYLAAALAWVQGVHESSAWAHMQPVLRAIMEVDPAPIVSIQRDGHAAEAWACSQLLQRLQPDWSLLEGCVVDSVPLSGNAKRPGDKGVKGELDAMLLDPAQMCQAVVEVKIGSHSPLKAIFGDLRKMQRLLACVKGQNVRLVSGREVQVAPWVMPCYLVVNDGKEPMDSGKAVQVAEDHLMKVSLSMALGSPGGGTWQRGVRVLDVRPDVVQLHAPASMVQATHKRVSDEFFSGLAKCDVYEVTRPTGAAW